MRVLASFVVAGIAAGFVLYAPNSIAQTASNGDVTGSLVTLINSGQYAFNRLERLSAIANQATYNQLTNDPDGANGPQTAICDANATQASGACSGNTFLVFKNVRELVQTANELLGGGAGRPTQYSLGSDAEGLGFALRWTAAEELSAQNSASKEFANTQIASIMSRITALRFGASGFSLAGMPVAVGSDGLLARVTPKKGGGASADLVSDSIATKWGGFVNGSFGWGDRAPTELEDAFAFDGKDLTGGIDYRVSRSLVVGGAVGYTRQRIDFDSSRSVVDGGIDSDGYSFTLYALTDFDGPYVSTSLGVQRLSIDSTRVITYPSFNINTESVYATARGSTNSTTLSATFNFGWPLTHKALGVEPYLRAEYSHNSIDAFKETSVDNLHGGQPAGFDFDFDKQTIKSFDSAVGFRLQYAFTPSFGVIQPYLVGEYHHNFEDGINSVRATYNSSSAGVFDLPGDEPDVDYYTFTAGASVVLKHGLQGFAQYRTVESLQYVKNHNIAVGIRGEF